MSTVTITPDAIEVEFSAVEKAAGLTGDLRVPRSAVRSAEVVDDALAAAHGLRVGLGVPGHRKLGTWHFRPDRMPRSATAWPRCNIPRVYRRC